MIQEIKILIVRIPYTLFSKKIITFFILNSKNTEIIEIKEDQVILKLEVFLDTQKEDKLKKIITEFEKIFNLKLEIINEYNISYEEWKKSKLKSFKAGIFSIEPLTNFTQDHKKDKNLQKNENYTIILDTLVGAFGIEQHPTTIMCLEMISELELELKESTAIDFGSGNGILSLALAKKNVKKIIAIEIFFNYCLEIKKNLKINNVDKVWIINTNSTKALEKLFKKDNFTLLVANVPLSAFKDKELNLLNINFNKAILSGIKKENKQEFLDIVKSYGITINEVREKEGWISIICEKIKRKT